MSWLAAAMNLRLAEIGGICFRLGALQLAVEAGEFGGALLDALLQRLIGALELLRRFYRLGDVGEGHDVTAILRHLARMELEDDVAAVQMLDDGAHESR